MAIGKQEQRIGDTGKAIYHRENMQMPQKPHLNIKINESLQIQSKGTFIYVSMILFIVTIV